MESADHRKELVAVAALALAVFLSFGDVLFGAKAFYLRDISRLHFPNKTIVRSVVQAGEFPSWNRAYSAGQPLAANPQFEVFYPGQWPIFLPDFAFGFQLHIVLHFALALAGMYLFLRTLPCSRLSAAAGAIAFGFAGPVASLADLPPELFGVAWIPWVLFGTRRYLLSGRSSDAAIAALSIGMQVLILDPAVLVETAILLLAILAIEWRRGLVAGLRRIAGLAAIGVAGAIAGAAQLVPAIDFVRDTVRGRGFTLEMVSFWSLPPARLLELIQPHFIGHTPMNGNEYWGQALYTHAEGYPFLANLYCGALVLVLALALVTVKTRGRMGFVAIGAGGVVLALGDFTPLLSLGYRLGIARSVRFPERFVVITAFVLAAAFAIALERLASDARLRRSALAIAAVLSTAAFAIFLLGSTAAYARLFGDLFELGAPAIESFAARSQIDWLVAAIMFAIAALLVQQFEQRPRFARAFAVVFVLTELAVASRSIAPRVDRRFFDAPPVAGSLSPSRGRIFFQPEWHESSPTARAYFSDRATTYALLRNGMFPRMTAIWGFRSVFERDIDGTTLATTDTLISSMWQVADTRRDWPDVFLPMSAVAYRAAYRPFNATAARDAARVAPIVFVPITSAPKYRFATSLVKIGGSDDFVRALSRNVASTNDYVETEPFTPSAGKVLRVAETSNTATADVTCEGRCYLVIAESWHRYWTATIDGREARVERTNLAYQGVAVPGGRHVVKLAYRNPLLVPSLIASVVATLLLLGIALARR